MGMTWARRCGDAWRPSIPKFRNVGSIRSELDPAKLKDLVVQAADCFAQVQTELLAFADLLERQASR